MNKPPLLKWGHFSHSDLTLEFKLECDALTEADWDCAAELIHKLVKPFSEVIGIPRGGLALSTRLDPYVTPDANRLLIVDDVALTGRSFAKALQDQGDRYGGERIQGAVLFTRCALPTWVHSVFLLTERLRN